MPVSTSQHLFIAAGMATGGDKYAGGGARGGGHARGRVPSDARLPGHIVRPRDRQAQPDADGVLLRALWDRLHAGRAGQGLPDRGQHQPGALPQRSLSQGKQLCWNRRFASHLTRN
eukprot:scaffold170047_cov30-Prasinocladus_malaysianus.AAC.1